MELQDRNVVLRKVYREKTGSWKKKQGLCRDREVTV